MDFLFCYLVKIYLIAGLLGFSVCLEIDTLDKKPFSGSIQDFSGQYHLSEVGPTVIPFLISSLASKKRFFSDLGQRLSRDDGLSKYEMIGAKSYSVREFPEPFLICQFGVAAIPILVSEYCQHSGNAAFDIGYRVCLYDIIEACNQASLNAPRPPLEGELLFDWLNENFREEMSRPICFPGKSITFVSERLKIKEETIAWLFLGSDGPFSDSAKSP